MRTVAAARSRAAFRLGFAFLFAVLLAVVVWFATPRGLRPPIDIVGYPSFEDFDYHRQFLAYRLLMWELPIVTLTVWWLLGRAGPFAVEPQPRTPVPLTDAPLPAGVDEETVRPEEPWSLWRYGRLLVNRCRGGGGGKHDRRRSTPRPVRDRRPGGPRGGRAGAAGRLLADARHARLPPALLT